MNKIRSFIFSEKKLSRAIFGFLIIAAFAFIFGPNIYAQFTRETGDAVGWGYGYGYGYGIDYDDNSNGYRIGGSGTESDYEYDYGYGNRATVQLTISAPSVTTSKVYDGSTTAAVTAGTLSGVVTGETVTVSAAANYSSASVGTSKAITVVYTLDGTDAGNYTKPIDYSTTGTITAASSGGGGGSYTPACTSVTYGDYAAACFVGYQYRAVLTRTPSNCSLTAAQQDAARKVCGAVPDVNVTGQGLINYQDANNTANFIALEKNLVKKINKALAKRLSGRILLQVEEHGEAWYVHPIDLLKYYLGRPADAFAIMRKFGLGVSEKDYTNFAKGTVPARLAGRILLRVQAHGEAYYVNPVDMKMNYMGRPADAFALMRKFGLGITNANLRQIGVGEIK
ncbi:MAG: YDG domain-containing protein [bacterium]|nr:YDG domain-containing protein [bacterium]